MQFRRLFAVPAACAVLAPTIHAQGSILAGRVLSDSGIVLVGAEVVLNGPQNLQRTDEKGEFRFTRVPAGFQIIGIRMSGFAVKVDTIEVEDAGEIRREYRLARVATELPRVPVTSTPVDRKLVEFHERSRLGAGRFLDSAAFANTRGTRMSDRLAKLPGVLMQRNGSEMFVTNTRQRIPGVPASRAMCRSLVWIDGVNVGTEFNVNQLDPSVIAAVEWYASTQIAPAKLAPPRRVSGTSMTGQVEDYCGVLVLWLR